MYKKISYLLFILLPCLVFGQGVDSLSAPELYPDQYEGIRITSEIDKKQITVGDQVTLSITISSGKSASVPVLFPTVEELTQEGIEALEIKMDTNGSQITENVTITSFESGNHTIEGIVVRVGKEEVPIAPAEKLTLKVNYVADVDTTKCEMMPDATYFNEPYTFWEIARWPLLGLLIAAIIAAVVWVIVRKKKNKPVLILPKAKPVPADKRALSELETLRRKELWQKGLIKRYYTDMTDIVRRYLYNMYGIKSAEMTSRQTLRAFHSIEDWSEESETMLRRLLEKADMVKFAKSQPETYEHDEAMQFAVNFVRLVAEKHKIAEQVRNEELKKK